MAIPTLVSSPFSLSEFDIVSTSPEVTIQQAAKFLHMSESRVVKLLDSGEIASRQVGSQRMVLRDSLIECEQDIQRMRTGMEEIVHLSEEMRLYE